MEKDERPLVSHRWRDKLSTTYSWLEEIFNISEAHGVGLTLTLETHCIFKAFKHRRKNI
jgi:hypothetical protein